MPFAGKEVAREAPIQWDAKPDKWPDRWGGEPGPLDRPSPEAFDRLARLTCRLLRAPAAHIAVVKGSSQVVRGWGSFSPAGSTRREIPLARSICEHVVRSAEPLMITDFRKPGEGGIAHVVPEFGGVAYMAVPLFAAQGYAFGALSVMDLEPREWSSDDLADLRDLGASVASELELAAAVLEAERRAEEASLARRERTALLEAAPQGICGFDADGRCTFINRAASQMLGIAVLDSIGRELHDVLRHSPADGTPYPPGACPLTGTMTTGAGLQLLNEIVRRRDDTQFPAELSAEPVIVGGRVTGGIVTISDVTERERLEARARFLGGTSDLLSASLDYETTLGSVARLAVPAMCDVCIVYILQPDDKISRLAVCAADEQKGRILDQLRERHPISLGSTGNSVARVMRSGIPELFETVADEQLRAASDQEPIRHLLRQLDLRSLVVVPLIARGRTLGALAFATSESGRRFGASDLAFAREVASRAALAIDNAELYRAAGSARGQAESANEAKAAFLAVMSHELRTPLSAVLGYAELLADGITGPVSEAQKEQLGRIKACAGQLLGLIDEILAFARLEADREDVRLDTVELGAMTRVAAALVEPRAVEKGLAFAVELPSPPITLETDPGKVGQILVHLLSNAIKFTTEGSVRLLVRVTDRQAYFEVSDTGVGIAMAHRDRIFERFWQVESPSTRAASGTGLGLTVARRLARLLGGDIEVESTEGEGSTFTLRLPLGAEGAPGS